MPRPRTPILLVDRPGDATRALVAALRGRGFEVFHVQDDDAAYRILDEEGVDAVVSELSAPHIDGMAILRHARKLDPDVGAVLLTAAAPLELALEAMREGAHDVLVQPVPPERVLAVLDRALDRRRLAGRVAEMEEGLDQRLGLAGLDGRSRAITRVLEQIQHLGSSRAPVLITGEAGTGKGLVARALHRHSPRRHERFVWMHCGALPAGQLERELFGEDDGLAPRPRAGRVELADGGTLFLEEIDEASALVQIRLLRLLQERRFERVGGSTTRVADVRLIASTTRDLDAETRAGRFRADLLQRISVVRIALPALRERREDIALLSRAAVREFDREHGRRVTGITAGALERLTHHHWPGNVRELRAVVEGMVVSAKGRRMLDVSDLPVSLRDATTPGERVEIAVGMSVEDAERRLIEATLRATGGDKPRAAAMLGIGLRTLYRKLDRR
ncbi:MAG: sigma-54-dependent transcriptional regulator [Candidatus Eisenbacteria bacterium]